MVSGQYEEVFLRIPENRCSGMIVKTVDPDQDRTVSNRTLWDWEETVLKYYNIEVCSAIGIRNSTHAIEP